MDNIENNVDPSGEADVTASQGQSAEVDTQPVETTEPVDGGQEEEAGQSTYPWEQDERFKGKTPEDIYQQIQEAEKLKGELSQKAKLVNKLEQTTNMSASQIEAALTQQEQQRMAEQIKANPGLAAYQEVQSLKGQLALQNEEKELDGFLRENPEYAPFKDKIFKLGLNLERDKSYADIAQEYFGESRAQGQQDAYQKIETKRNTQATGASQAAPKSRLTPEEMDNMTAAELEAILPHADISNRPY